MKRTTLQRTLAALLTLSLVLGVPATAAARQGGTTRYVYDDNGRLHAVVAPTGEAAVYEYDGAGNITNVRRLAAGELVLFSFTPREGIYGDLVTFSGVGFGAGVTGVSFNGTAAQVVEVTPSSVAAVVPEGATTGPVTITTPAGAATTAAPFVVRGIRISPSSARVLFGGSIQFVVRAVPAPAEGEVTWSVNGAAGGDAAVGTITPGGLYTAPQQAVEVTVRATHAAFPDIPAEAQVTLRDPEDVSELQAPAVSIMRGLTDGAAVAARPLAIQFGHPTGINHVLGAAASVSYGYITQPPPRSPALSISYGGPGGQTGASASVSVTTGPHIASVGPAQAAPGSTVTLTIMGRNFSGANAVRFLAPSGTVDSALAVSNIVVNAEGTLLTATVAVAVNAAAGERVVIVTTPAARSLTAGVGSNVFRIVAQ